MAAVRAEVALQSAQAMNHPSEMGLSQAFLIQSVLGLGKPEQAIAQFDALCKQIDRLMLSCHARTAIEQAARQMQQN
ncbi:MAG: hypothetical protein HY785_22910 [Oscillatoriophycideae cyanobacterium NC_groundwater_1537_Pr4_S-0.65um_50_18]|nr:hypothetical protein [Oscillatoriophycideae cyanobacterium NC_groundwater_1537_Pr4_S-0.65um_50_18]